MGLLRLNDLHLRFGGVTALAGVNIEIQTGDFFAHRGLLFGQLLALGAPRCRLIELLDLRLDIFLLAGQRFAEDPAKVRQRRICRDRLQLERRVGVDLLLLGFDQVLVLEEPFDQALVQRTRDVGHQKLR